MQVSCRYEKAGFGADLRPGWTGQIDSNKIPYLLEKWKCSTLYVKYRPPSIHKNNMGLDDVSIMYEG